MASADRKEVQKRWRSIRDSYTKAYRQGKCVLPEQCPPGSRRFQYHRQMLFLLRALQNKKPRYSQDKYESFSEVSNSPQHSAPDDVPPKIKNEIIDKPLDLKTKPVEPERLTQDQCNQTTIEERTETVKNPQLEIKIDANSILPDDHFDDDKLFMNSLIPLFKKMDDDTRLLCRIECLKIIRFALQGNKCFEALRLAEDSFFKTRITGILAKNELETNASHQHDSKVESRLSMTTRSADGSRPIRKRRMRSPSPLPTPPKRRGPGRPRKVRPPPSDSDEEPTKRSPRLSKTPKMRVQPAAARDLPPHPDMEDSYCTATSVAQLSTPMFMKMYNLGPSKSSTFTSTANCMQVSIKTEPVDECSG
ncbi:hypothetical protein NE865_07956 [Phthorimaea operculella]|nr:hypothetical protein NE865_07956 [Phthorimaea operculella]